MVGLAAPFAENGIGFDYRLAMGVTDMWFKLFDIPDEAWDMYYLFNEAVNSRKDERTISYVECHDQAIVGGQTAAFRLIGNDMYEYMSKFHLSPAVTRGTALHKLARLLTFSCSDSGYLNFMGNEFGHPEWIDFPREGNGWSFKHARRQWSLAEPDYLRYRYLRNFDKAMIHLAHQESILDEKPELFVQDEEKKILIFKRKSCIFALNFNPTASFADYGFAAPAGKYEAVLNTDENEFDGFSRLKTGEEHFSVSAKSENGNGKYDETLSLYLPSRCAIVLKKID
jgi:1,4-alpha-glucan branching enzyme